MEIMPEDRKEEKADVPHSAVTYPGDPDAARIKKRKICCKKSKCDGSAFRVL